MLSISNYQGKCWKFKNDYTSSTTKQCELKNNHLRVRVCMAQFESTFYIVYQLKDELPKTHQCMTFIGRNLYKNCLVCDKICVVS